MNAHLLPLLYPVRCPCGNLTVVTGQETRPDLCYPCWLAEVRS